MSKTSRRDVPRQAIEGVRAVVGDYKAQRAAVVGNSDYSDTYKKRLAATLQGDAEARALASLKDGRKQVLGALESARADLLRVRQEADKGYDYARMAFLAAEYSARLSAPSNAFTGDASPVARVALLYDEAKAGQDKEALRALRVAAAPFVAAHRDDESEHAAALLSAWREDDERAAAPIAALQWEVSELERGLAAVDAEALRAEEAISGYFQSGWAQEPTPWQKQLGTAEYRVPGADALVVG